MGSVPEVVFECKAFVPFVPGMAEGEVVQVYGRTATVQEPFPHHEGFPFSASLYVKLLGVPFTVTLRSLGAGLMNVRAGLACFACGRGVRSFEDRSAACGQDGLIGLPASLRGLDGHPFMNVDHVAQAVDPALARRMGIGQGIGPSVGHRLESLVGAAFAGHRVGDPLAVTMAAEVLAYPIFAYVRTCFLLAEGEPATFADAWGALVTALPLASHSPEVMAVAGMVTPPASTWLAEEASW